MDFEQLSLFTLEEYQSKLLVSKQSEYLQVEGEIPTDLPDNSLISIKRKAPLKIYSLGFQPAKFIPEIPRWFLKKYAVLPYTVLEPFSGSGTTLLESLLYGASVFWLDYQPLSRLICQVKTTEVDLSLLLKSGYSLLTKARTQTLAPTTISFANKDFWFQKPVQEGLEILRAFILECEAAFHSVLWLVFSLTVRKVSDMNEGMILAARRSSFKAIFPKSREDVFQNFLMYLEKTIEALKEWKTLRFKSTGKAVELSSQDARFLEGNWKCDAVITSPPYINAIDYVWASKFELHWLGLINSDQDRLDLYSQEIGTERIPRQEYQELGKTNIDILDHLILDIYTGKFYQASKGQNKLRARVVFKYFTDMKTHLIQSFSKLKPGGYYCFTVGDVSKICGVEIPLACLLTQIAVDIGFNFDFQFNLLLKNRKLNLPRNVDWAGTIKHDTVVVLQKPVK